MVPSSIRYRLGQLRLRESSLRLAWGLARCLVLVAVLLAVACLIDWAIDHWQETPWPLRFAMFVGQAMAAASALLIFVVVPVVVRRPGNAELALMVEEKHPALAHRLISAVQLNGPGADTKGMSPELIGRVTKEAERQVEPLNFGAVADHGRLLLSAAVAGPVVLVGLLALLIWPEMVSILFARQLLGDVEIPRSVYLVGTAPDNWVRPSNEDVELVFQVRGTGAGPGLEGAVEVTPEGRDTEHYVLQLKSLDPDGKAKYFARIPAMAANFHYTAWLEDGRTPHAKRVEFVPRPIVAELRATLLLPTYVGVKPGGGERRYELGQEEGEIVGLLGSRARVHIKVQTPVTQAFVELLGSPGSRPRRVQKEAGSSPEAGSKTAVFEFDVLPEYTAYQVVVIDRHGFDNVPPPRRGIRLVPEEPPQVTLLPEQFNPSGPFRDLGGPAEDFQMEGMPVPLGAKMRVAYTCRGPWGLGHAKMMFRVVKKRANDGPEEVGDTSVPWRPYLLKEPKAAADVGAFDLNRGVFKLSGADDEVPFYAVPSPLPETELGRQDGGGRFDFETAGIPDYYKGGRPIELKAGDQVEYYIEVSARDRPTGKVPVGKSEIRVKTIVSIPEFVRWLDDTLQEERRVRQLEAKQRGVFDTN
jgi:hypothetical protein